MNYDLLSVLDGLMRIEALNSLVMDHRPVDRDHNEVENYTH